MNTKLMIFAGLMVAMALGASAQDRLLLVNPTNSSIRKVSSIQVTNGVIVTPQCVTSGAVNGTNAGPGVVGQVVKLNASGVVDSTLLGSSAWQTNVNMQAFVAFTTTTWTNLLVVTPSKTNGTVFVVARATCAEVDASSALKTVRTQLLRVDGLTTNVVGGAMGTLADVPSTGVTPVITGLFSLTNSPTTFILQGWASNGDGVDGWIGTNTVVNGVSVENGTSMSILGF